jgi:hypothetical protein
VAWRVGPARRNSAPSVSFGAAANRAGCSDLAIAALFRRQEDVILGSFAVLVIVDFQR